jgi:hypothetical protein
MRHRSQRRAHPRILRTNNSVYKIATRKQPGCRPVYDSGQTRQCTKCGRSYAETPEHFGQVKPGQVRPQCRNCEREKNKEYDRRNDRSERDTKRRNLENGFRLSDDQKHMMLKRQHGMCLLCAKPLGTITQSSVDHMIPLSRGGTNEIRNLHLVHRRCNTDKKDKTVREHCNWRVESGFDEVSIGDRLGIVGEPTFS